MNGVTNNFLVIKCNDTNTTSVKHRNIRICVEGRGGESLDSLSFQYDCFYRHRSYFRGVAVGKQPAGEGVATSPENMFYFKFLV